MEHRLLNSLLQSWIITLKARQKARETVRVYKTSVEDFLASYDELTKKNVIAWLAQLADEGAETATIRVRLAGVKQFAKWLAEEEDFDADGILAVKPPRLRQRPVPALSEAEVAAMIKTCSGGSFRDKRDRAMLMLFAETGLRASEMLGLSMSDVRVVDCVAIVQKGKGGDYRRVKFSAACAAELDRYIRARQRAGIDMASGPLWIGRTRALRYQDMVASLKKRAEIAGVTGFHVHRLRHTMAVRWLSAGGSETGLMAQAGWKSREMVERYVKTSAEELAASEFDRLNMGLTL